LSGFGIVEWLAAKNYFGGSGETFFLTALS